MGIDDLLNNIKEEHKVLYKYDFRLVNGDVYYQLYFRTDFYGNPRQLKLWGDDEWKSMKSGSYEK
jgi:hypothetical protein